jgi:hypothetical protein
MSLSIAVPFLAFFTVTPLMLFFQAAPAHDPNATIRQDLESLRAHFEQQHSSIDNHLTRLDEDVRLTLDIRKQVITNTEALRILEKAAAEGKNEPVAIAVLQAEVERMDGTMTWVLRGVISSVLAVISWIALWLYHSRTIRIQLAATNLRQDHLSTKMAASLSNMDLDLKNAHAIYTGDQKRMQETYRGKDGC